MPSPYNLMNEGSSETDGRHDTTWGEAFPSNLKPPSYVQPPSVKSLKDTKLFSTTSPETNAFSHDSTTAPPQQLQVSYDDINMGQQTNPPLVASSDANGNAAAADSTFNPNPVIQPFVPEIHPGDVGAGNAPFLSSFNTPDLTAQAFEGDFLGA
ncbi:hypothetical protein MMC07_006582 [Pseudocyphellaria aurata]|nr:hypothetical protein [Pseudocyphellaria aurata]